MEGKICYLIVEDEEKSRETLLKKIEMCNIPDIVCTGMASNATEAMMLAKLTPPDFLLLDINLPGKNGFELIAGLNELDQYPQVIFTSAHTESEILLNALKKSPASYLVKPIDLDELEAAIRAVCELHRKGNSNRNKTNRIKFNAYNGPLFLYPEQIMMVKSELHQSKLYCINGDIVQLNQSIGSFGDGSTLCELPFYKADRSTIVNLTYVEQFLPKRGECLLRSDNYTVTAQLSQNGLKRLIDLVEQGW